MCLRDLFGKIPSTHHHVSSYKEWSEIEKVKKKIKGLKGDNEARCVLSQDLKRIIS